MDTCIEVFIFDFDGDIYGSDLKVEFIDYIRGEIKFPDPSYLVEQMQQDAQTARKCLRRPKAG